jgi:YegS/Rv2252/BmrU family lipid kinase
MKRSEKILIIFNNSAGKKSKDKLASIVFRELRDHFHTVSIIYSDSPEHSREIIANSSDFYHIIAVFGGDGTINSIGLELLDKDITLGILPGGSGNGLARNIHIPMSWRKSIQTLKHGKDVKFDAGKINGHYFFNVAGIGLDGYISKKFNHESRSRGVLPYIYYAVKGIFECPIYHIEATIDGNHTFEDKIVLAAFANFRQYGGRAIIAPQASGTDQHLDFCMLNRFKFRSALFHIPKLFRGKIDKVSFYNHYLFKQLKIKSLSGPIPCTIDGEYKIGDAEEFTIDTQASKIKLRVPAEYQY